MIARVWRGRTTVQNAEAYRRHFHNSVRPELERIAGFRGVYLLQREKTEFLVITLWDSMEAIRTFAGHDPERAVVAPAARALLSDFDEGVKHYEIAEC